MAKIKASELGKAIEQELTIYHDEVTERVNKLSAKAAKDLVKKTKATAPVGPRHGQFKSNIASKRVSKGANGDTYAWYVKAPDYRLTHLLVHGHATADGGRTKSNSFLSDALETVLPEYEREVEEALKQ